MGHLAKNGIVFPPRHTGVSFRWGLDPAENASVKDAGQKEGTRFIGRLARERRSGTLNIGRSGTDIQKRHQNQGGDKEVFHVQDC
jgi:hypothetical protein